MKGTASQRQHVHQPFTHGLVTYYVPGLGTVVGEGGIPGNTKAVSSSEEVSGRLGEGLWVNKTHLAKEQATPTHQQSGLTSASLLIRAENVPLLALADVRARCVEAEVGTVVFQDTAHVDRCKGRQRR